MEKFKRPASVLEKGPEDPLVKAEEKGLEEVVRQAEQEFKEIQNLLPAPEISVAAEVKEPVKKLPTITLNYWFQEMQKKPEKLDIETQELINKANAGESLNEVEKDFLRKSKEAFWQEHYGMSFSDWQEQQRKMPKKIELSLEKWLRQKNWAGVMKHFAADFDPRLQKIINKKVNGVRLSGEEARDLDMARNRFWKEKFGVAFSERSKIAAQKMEQKPKLEKSKSPKLKKSKRKILPVEFKYANISEQERLDATMDTREGGWQRYWLKRLLPEVELLPDSVKEIVLKYQGDTAGFIGILAVYVNKRAAAKRFELSKREEVAKLKNNLREIDARQDFSPEAAKDRRTVFFNPETQNLFVEDQKGNKKELMFGDLIGDCAWGILYKPDTSVPPKLWRKIRKTLALYEAKVNVARIFNQELNYEYHTGLPTTALDVDFINESLKNSKRANSLAGVIAERMITEFLTRTQYNNPNLGLKVETSNALEDAILKYDFKVIVKKRRGIALESEDMPREIFAENKRKVGIQFTVGRGAGKLKDIKKGRAKIAEFENLIKNKVDEITLLKMRNLKGFADLQYRRWIKEGRPSGGPEQYLSREEKLAIFKQATRGLIELSDQELEKLKI